MRLLHYLEIENFKRFGDKQRIELDHPTVLIGPNNCGKTSAIQAMALWSQALKTWFDSNKNSSAVKRTGKPLNRLSIVSVPVQSTRYFWHNTEVRKSGNNIPILITVGVQWQNSIYPLTMQLDSHGSDLVYCKPLQTDIKLIEYAASLNVALLYPMSGLETEEPVLQPGRIDVLLGQGQTAQVLRNLCLIVAKESENDWRHICALMKRLFSIELGVPKETSRGAIELFYKQNNVKELLDISLSGRGLQQMLMIFAYLYHKKRSVLLVDEPDAHLEILRQRQIYVLLRDIAQKNDSQVILVTHSEVILGESLDQNLTLLLNGQTESITNKNQIINTLKRFGAEHYVKARERGYVLYLEGSTDYDILKSLAIKTKHEIVDVWDDRVNTYYVQDTFPDQTMEKELERVEGAYGLDPRKHFFELRGMIPEIKGLAILDSDGNTKESFIDGGLNIVYWDQYEIENYFITPEVLLSFACEKYNDQELFGGYRYEIQEALEETILETIFNDEQEDYGVYKNTPDRNAARIIWESKVKTKKLSVFAENFFVNLANKLGGHPVLLRKGNFHQLVEFSDVKYYSKEVKEKLDLLYEIFKLAKKNE